MTDQLLLRQKIVGKARAAAKFLMVMSRFIIHPGDFLRLYQREASVADSVLDIAVLSLEQEFQERIAALEARIAILEARAIVVPDATE
jgi:hypothetical protein